MARNEAISTLANQMCKILLLNDITKNYYTKLESLEMIQVHRLE
jgi:hypothetical protein